VTSTDAASWYVVPADDKENARLIVSQILLDTFEGLDMHYPKSRSSPVSVGLRIMHFHKDDAGFFTPWRSPRG
jgi:hypothetical protein